MNKHLKYGAIALGALVLILLAIPLFINANSFRPTIEKQLTEALGRKVQVGNLSLSIFSGSFSADDFSIADDPKFSPKPFLTAKSFHVGIEVWPLITSKALNVTGLTIEKPELNLVRNQEGRWNFSTLGSSDAASTPQGKTPGQPAPGFQIAKLELKDGRATISSTGSSKPSVYDNVDMELSNLSLQSQFPAVVTANLPGGGTFRLEGNMGPLNPTDASLTPLDAKVTIKGLDLAKSGFVDSGSGVAGIVDVANTLVSENGTAHAQGTVNVTKMQLVNGGAPSSVPVDIDFVIDYVLASSTGTISQGNIRIGKALAHLTGTFQQTGNDTVVNLKLNGESMPVGDLQAALPAVGVILPKGSSLKSGTASANLAIQGPASKGVATGNVGLFNAQLAGFDVSSGLSAITKLAGHQSSPDTSIQKFTANVRASQTGLDASAIDAVVPALGSVTGAGTVSASGALNFNMVASVNAGSVTGGIPGLKSTSTGGPMKIPFAIQGTTSDPKFIPDTAGIARSAITGVAQQQLGGLAGNNAAASQATSALSGLMGGKKKKK
jgi:AsmA protein